MIVRKKYEEHILKIYLGEKKTIKSICRDIIQNSRYEWGVDEFSLKESKIIKYPKISEIEKLLEYDVYKVKRFYLRKTYVRELIRHLYFYAGYRKLYKD